MWASISYCPGGGGAGPWITIYKYPTQQQALDAKKDIDRGGCGGGCREWHQVKAVLSDYRPKKLKNPYTGQMECVGFV